MSCAWCTPIGESPRMCEMYYTVTDADGRDWHFNWDPNQGVTVLTLTGEPRVRQPDIKSKFWEPFKAWQATVGVRS